MAKVVKSRYWTFIMYPDSRPEDWQDVLSRTGLSIAISPLHEWDINPTGELKKPHYHVLLCFDGPTTESNVQRISESVNGTSAVFPVSSVRGMYRYHCHLDNPEKAQYNEEDRILLNGFNINDYSQMTTQEETILVQSILSYIRSNNITEYSDLCDRLSEEDIQAFEYTIHHTLYFNTYLTSKRNKKRLHPDIS